MSKEPRIAVIHDELIRRGGAEVVFEEIIKIFPQADVYALYASNNPQITVNGITYPIRTSFLQRLPLWFRKHPGRMLPLLPQAAEQFDFSQYDLVISSASGFAKGIVTRSAISHICYCHTPTRYAWDSTQEAMQRVSKIMRVPLSLILHYIRMADFAAAQRPDVMLANSEYTKKRIATYYKRPSKIIYPPIETSFFTPSPIPLSERSHFLIVARLTPLKYIDHAIHVCEKLQLPLTIIGVGREYAHLKSLAGKHTRFLGKVSRYDLRERYRSARALLQPGVEDFGMASVEALSCGIPVIAFGQGGAVEIIDSPSLGQLYFNQSPEGLAEGIRQFMLREKKFSPAILQHHAFKYSSARFRDELTKQVENALRQRSTNDYT